jgi:hypothetical protein
MDEEIDLFDAIKEMRKLSSEGKNFSFIHATYDRSRQISNGMRKVEAAYLRPAARGEDNEFADFKLFYYDLDIRKNRNCWQVLLMYFNGKKCILN